MNAVYEFIVQLESFKNIDLFRQGLYGIRICVRAEENMPISTETNEITLGLPYHILKSSSANRHRDFDPNSHLSLPSTINDEDFSFLSQTFRVQYCEQEIGLNDGCLFRLELEANKRLPIYIIIELLFHEYTSNDAAISKPAPTRQDFEVVCSKKLKIDDIYGNGVHTFYPVTFDDQHFSLMNIMVHGLLTDFKYRPKIRHRVITTTNDILEGNVPINLDEKHPQTFADSIFDSHRIDPITNNIKPLLPSQLSEIANSHHRYYIDSLIVGYNRLAQKFVEYMKNAISPHLHESMSIAIHRMQPNSSNKSQENNVNHEKFGISSVLVTDEIGEPRNDTNDVMFPFPKLYPLSERLTRNKLLTEKSIAYTIKSDISYFAQQNFALWSVFHQVLPRCCYPLARYMKKQWTTITRDYFGSFVFREILPIQDRWKVAADDLELVHSHIAGVTRKSHSNGTIVSLPIEDCDLIAPADQSIVIFDQTYTIDPKEYRKQTKIITPSNNNNINNNDDSKSSSSSINIIDNVKKKEKKNLDKKKKKEIKKNSKNNIIDEKVDIWDILKDSPPFDGEPEEIYPGRHLWIFVHGYQGNSWDMRIFKNILSVTFPNHIYMLSKANEIDSEGDISIMGRKLAAEIDEFVTDNCRGSLGRISFVCHSLGGVIVRSALTHSLMKPYLDRMYTMLSLATPHCGYLYSNNSIVDAGIWALKKWNKSLCLSQLSLTDSLNDDLYETYMYKLSEKKGLEYFKNILLVASMEDKYAPFHSARIELHRDALQDKKRGPVYNAMVNSLIAPLDNVTLKRIHISFVHKRKSLDTFIGRSAHIYFLDQALYMNMLVSVYHDYLK